MTFTPFPRGKVSQDNTELKLDTAVYSQHYAAAGSALPGSDSFDATRASLGAGFSTVPGAYVGSIIAVSREPIVGEYRVISAYDEVNGIVTVTEPWGHTPVNGAVTSILCNSGQLGTQDGLRSIYTLKLPSGFSATDDFYQHAVVCVLTGEARGEFAPVISYDGSTNVATCSRPFSRRPASGDLVQVSAESGTCTAAGSASTLQADNTTLSTAARVVGLTVELVAGTGAGQVRVTGAVSENALLTVTEDFETAPDSTTVYKIYGGFGGTVLASVLNATAVSVCFDNQSNVRSGFMRLVQTTAADGNMAEGSLLAVKQDTMMNQYVETVTGTHAGLRINGLGFPVSGVSQMLLSSFKHASESKSALPGPECKYASKTPVDANMVQRSTFAYGVPGSETLRVGLGAATVFAVTQRGAGLAQIQDITMPSGAALADSGTGGWFSITDGDSNLFHVWYNVDAGSDAPVGLPGTLVPVSVGSADDSGTVATKTETELDGLAGTPFASTATDRILSVVNTVSNQVDSVVNGTMPTASESTVYDSGALTGTSVSVSTREFGDCVRFSATFGPGAEGRRQLVGLTGAQVGYADGQVVVSVTAGTGHRDTVAVLTLVAAGPVGDAVLTLDDLVITVPVTETASSALLALEVASAVDYSVYSYRAEAVGDTVVFSSATARGNGEFALASGTSGATGNWASPVTAVVPSVTYYPQYAWTHDRLDGTGASGHVLDLERSNTFVLLASESSLVFCILLEEEQPLVFHEHFGHWPHPRRGLCTVSGDAASTLTLSSMTVHAEPLPMLLLPRFTSTHTHAGVDGARKDTAIIRLTNPQVFRSTKSEVVMHLGAVTLVTSVANVVVTVQGVISGTPSTQVAGSYVAENVSAAVVSSPGENIATVNGGRKLFSGTVGTTDLKGITLHPGEHLDLVYTCLDPTLMDLGVSVWWVEAQ